MAGGKEGEGPRGEPTPQQTKQAQAPAQGGSERTGLQHRSETELKRHIEEMQARFAKGHLEEIRAVSEQDPPLFASRVLEGLKAVVELGDRKRRVKDKLEDELRPYRKARVEAYRRTRNPRFPRI